MLTDRELRLFRQIKKEHSPYPRDTGHEMAAMAVTICRAAKIDTEGFLDMWRRVRNDTYFLFKDDNHATHPDGTT